MSETASDIAGKRKTEDGQDLPWRGYKLSEALPILQKIASNDFDVWNWGRNTHCKYVTVEIDTRDGGFVRLKDRDGKAISIADVEFQYRGGLLVERAKGE